MTTRPAPQLNSDDLEQLSAYLDRQLSDTERGVLEARLREEPALREALDELRATVAALRGLEPLRPPRSFTISPAVARQHAPWWSRLLRPAGGLVGALMVLVIAVGLIRSMSFGAGAPAAPAQMSAAAPTSDLAAEAPAVRDAQTLRVADPTAAPAGTLAPPQAAIVAESAATPAPAPTMAPADAAIAASPAEAPAPEPTQLPIGAPAAEPAAPAATAAPAAEPTAAPAAAPPLAYDVTASPAPTMAPADAAAADSAGAAPETPSAKIADAPGEAANPIATAPLSSPGTDALQNQPPLSPQESAPVGMPLGIPFALAALLLIGALALWLRRRR